MARVAELFSAPSTTRLETVKEDGAVLPAERANGLRRASVRDVHSLRVTCVTLALTAGVPLELVQRVTAHKTNDVVLKRYSGRGPADGRLSEPLRSNTAERQAL